MVMRNLIEQQESLKGLGDDQLRAEMENPSGDVPPFLILSEINRRKSARDRYEGEQARRDGGSSTVAEDVMKSQLGDRATASPGLRNAGAPGEIMPPMSGMSRPVPRGGLPGAPATFAGGGLVDYAEPMQARFAELLKGLPERRNETRALALIQAGLGIMGGDSPFPMVNIGQGAMPALTSYREGLNDLTDTELALMNAQLSTAQTVRGDELAALELSFRERQAERENELARERLEAPTADESNYATYQSLSPEERQVWNEANNPSTLSGKTAADENYRAAQAFRTIYSDEVKKAVEDMGYIKPGPEGAAQRAEATEIARQRAVESFRYIYPQWADRAAAYSVQLKNAPAAPSGPFEIVDSLPNDGADIRSLVDDALYGNDGPTWPTAEPDLTGWWQQKK